ncbi:protein NDNF [Orussus abietinus]|uniref:protein NDNF n=1 Tax=Orussus abietinus TaxID=222816 RepID=UPI000626BC61|nr:protein NDNF [Orussus abietinus]
MPLVEGLLVALLLVAASLDRRTCLGVLAEGQRHLQMQMQMQMQMQVPPRHQTIGSPRPFGAEKPSRFEEFNRTGVLHPEYQTPATLHPGNVSQFYYLSPREGPPLTLLVSPCSGPISWTVSYVGPPEDGQQSEGAKSQTRWPVKTLVPGSPLFTYEGVEAQNFTIPRARAGLYRFEMKSIPEGDGNSKSERSDTVLLYATTSSLDLSGPYEDAKGRRHHSLRFQQRRSRRRLTVSWSKSHVDPHLSDYCLAVTSGSQWHPPTLCAAQNTLRVHPRPTRGGSSREHQHRGVPEGLHCVRQTRLTLHGMKYNTTYNFTLYVVSMRNNVSSRAASEAHKFRKTPAQTLRIGRYAIANLRRNDGYINFRYRPKDNTSTIFHVLPCGGGIVRAKLRGPGFLKEKEVVGHASLTAPAVSPGKRYMLRISATPQELVRVSVVKVLAAQEGSIVYPEVPSKSPPREYRSLRKCHEVTVGVEPAGAAKYCVLVRELRGSMLSNGITTVPDQCGLHRRRRSEYTYELCEEKTSPPTDRALPFTVRKLQPGRAYVIQITAQVQGQFLSYPLLGVRTRKSCQP